MYINDYHQYYFDNISEKIKLKMDVFVIFLYLIVTKDTYFFNELLKEMKYLYLFFTNFIAAKNDAKYRDCDDQCIFKKVSIFLHKNKNSVESIIINKKEHYKELIISTNTLINELKINISEHYLELFKLVKYILMQYIDIENFVDNNICSNILNAQSLITKHNENVESFYNTKIIFEYLNIQDLNLKNNLLTMNDVKLLIDLSFEKKEYSINNQ